MQSPPELISRVILPSGPNQLRPKQIYLAALRVLVDIYFAVSGPVVSCASLQISCQQSGLTHCQTSHISPMLSQIPRCSVCALLLTSTLIFQCSLSLQMSSLFVDLQSGLGLGRSHIHYMTPKSFSTVQLHEAISSDLKALGGLKGHFLSHRSPSCTVPTEIPPDQTYAWPQSATSFILAFVPQDSACCNLVGVTVHIPALFLFMFLFVSSSQHRSLFILSLHLLTFECLHLDSEITQL